MALDGRFFSPFARLSRRGTPVAAIAMIGVLALGLLGVMFWRGSSDAISPVLSGVVFIDGVFFALTGAALFVIRAREGAREPGFRVPGYPVVPALFVIGELGVVVGSYLDPSVRGASYVGVAWMAAALIAYAVWFRGPRATRV
jgi:APA family basic amino acid/polyamine antiporter